MLLLIKCYCLKYSKNFIEYLFFISHSYYPEIYIYLYTYFFYFSFRYKAIGKLSGSYQAAIMCLAVDNNGQDKNTVVTGSKDHYIKV